MPEFIKFDQLPSEIQKKWKEKIFDTSDVSLSYSPGGFPYIETLKLQAFVTDLRVKLMKESTKKNALNLHNPIHEYQKLKLMITDKVPDFSEKQNILIIADGPSKDEDLEVIGKFFQNNPLLRRKTLIVSVNRITKVLMHQYNIIPDVVVVTDVLSGAKIIKRDDEISFDNDEIMLLKNTCLAGLFYVNYLYFEKWPGPSFLFFEPGKTDIYKELFAPFEKELSREAMTKSTLYYGANVSSACFSIAINILSDSIKKIFFVGHDFGASTAQISSQDALSPDNYSLPEGSTIVVNDEGYLALVPHALYEIYDDQTEAAVNIFKENAGKYIDCINYSKGSFGFSPDGVVIKSIDTIERLPEEKDFSF
ncbi:MAG: DUF115 domain-containing protein [bacterium]|nr:DUF115 domain-containing protein [bacterium]